MTSRSALKLSQQITFINGALASASTHSQRGFCHTSNFLQCRNLCTLTSSRHPTLAFSSLENAAIPVRFLSTAHKDDAAPPQPQDKVAQLKQAVRDYGATVVVFHIGLALTSLGLFYTAVSSGIDMVALVGRIPVIGEKLSGSELASGASTFVVAYAVHKVFAPVRISITLTSAPFIVRYLRAKGVLKHKKK